MGNAEITANWYRSMGTAEKAPVRGGWVAEDGTVYEEDNG